MGGGGGEGGSISKPLWVARELHRSHSRHRGRFEIMQILPGTDKICR